MLVRTPTTDDNIQNVESAIESSRYVLLQGTVGAGKSLMANHAAERTGTKDTMLHINVDDTFDSKDLLGKFSATDVPGAFEWTPGPLTTAVEEGRWVLMEDIDLASFDVFSVILTLLESDRLFIADKNRTVKAHPNFKLIATQQVVSSGDSFLTRKSTSIPSLELWTVVIVRSLPAEEAFTVASRLFSHVPQAILQRVMAVVFEVSGRPLSVRDALKWASRVERISPDTQGFVASTVCETIFHEALDIFCARIPPSPAREELSSRLATACGVSSGVAESITKLHKPIIHVAPDTVCIGRQRLPRLSRDLVARESRIVFSETQHSMSLLERIAGSVSNNEPVLLTGETGVGKTFIVQYLADQVGQELVVHNLNQQTDAGDFMGGWKPQDIGTMVRPLFVEFDSLFKKTFDAEKNRAFLTALGQAVDKRLWEVVLKQFQKGVQSFSVKQQSGLLDAALIDTWLSLKARVDEAISIVDQAKTSFMFKFEEGSLVRAWKEGHWILLDEVNLATSEVLERVSSVLGDVTKLFISERGDTLAIQRHPNFRVFANMNPPTDVGKKDLPPALRSKFTEFFVDDPFAINDLCVIVNDYIGFLAADAKVVEIATFFLDCVSNARTTLCDLDGESQPPHFSLRTLTRALTYVRNATSLYGFHTALWDGLMLGFATPLQRKFHATVESLIAKNIFKGKLPPAPTLPHVANSKQLVPYEHIWLEAGDEVQQADPHFIVTASVSNHLKNLARAVFAKRPVLLEGPTSAGKSSMVQYLARLSGHKFVRINNHESTEIQEYIGHYVSDEHGKLRFVDGILVDAVRNGHWVVLDELNLAPTEVLEALNRLLDDNCELFIADTQETVRPHPQLRIFATQNPAGLYGGRKLLSRAFRNRFLEITVDDIPTDEIKEILRERYVLAPSFAEKMVEVMKALQLRRQASHLFAGKHGYITPRDLFRWGERAPATYQELANHGFLLLAERCRKQEERQVVKDVIEAVMRVNIDEDDVYSPSRWPFVAEQYAKVEAGVLGQYKIVWTPSMRRLFTIVGICLWRKEPVLLVGETGSSKTTICQLWAHLLELPLHMVNCHQHTEAADFLGGLRPVPLDQRQDALFAWSDGPLVRCMTQGSMFVLDEISLAEDSVLERLNSVLEPGRSLTLAEKSSCDTVVAAESFRVLATMNPGGDFGKKELSPALRNRFTEIYVRPTTNRCEIEQIIAQKLNVRLHPYAKHMAELLCTASQSRIHGGVTHLSIRDIIGWTSFMNAADGSCLDDILFLHGLDAVILDGCSVGAGQSEASADSLRRDCIAAARRMVPFDDAVLQKPFWEVCSEAVKPEMPEDMKHLFFFDAPTTKRNLSKLMRALVMPKAVLLEGSPGVGKTSIVEALGMALQKTVVRINLSDQTDIMDLFGTFLPCSGDEGSGPSFSWSDGVLLRAVKAGHWVILDELNLASQSVLEGLNALLDHRSTVYVPELCMEITASPGFRVFACQNPLLEGGGRKGLPKSFLNRFTRVRVEPFSREDLVGIATVLCPEFETAIIEGMVDYVCVLQQETSTRRTFGLRGSPWEFNLRDVLRWAKTMRSYSSIASPELCVHMLFLQRFRSDEDRKAAGALFTVITKRSLPLPSPVVFSIKHGAVFGDGLHLAQQYEGSTIRGEAPTLLLPSQSHVVKSILTCARNNQFCLLTGSAGSGKSRALAAAAMLCNARLVTFSITSSCDTVDLLGGFDQVEGKQGQFEWRDSALVDAMLHGYWLVLDNANFCNASVLDRLNPLVEPNGSLSINEQGLVAGETRVVHPHPKFRLFATMDPKYGEISRAMRNRSIEVYVQSIPIPSAESSMIAGAAAHSSRLPLTDKTLQQLQYFHASFLRAVHHVDPAIPGGMQLVDAVAAGAPNTYTLLKTVHMMLFKGSSTESESLAAAIVHRYMRNRSGSWITARAAIESALQGIQNIVVCGREISKLLKAVQADPTDLAISLDRMRVCRSALHFLTALDPEAALCYFLLDQCYDKGTSATMMEERSRIATEFIHANTLPVASVHNFIHEIGCHTLEFAELLFMRVQLLCGPGQRMLSLTGRQPTSDSSMVNTCATKLFDDLSHFLHHSTTMPLFLTTVRYSEALVSHLTSEDEPLSRVNFLPVVTTLLLLRKILAHSLDVNAPTVLDSVEQLINALQRHLNLGHLESATPPLLKRSPRPTPTSEAERQVMVLAAAAATAHEERLMKSMPVMQPLYQWALAHHELHLVLLLLHAAGAQSIPEQRHASEGLRKAIKAFISTFHLQLHLLTEMRVATWQLIVRATESQSIESLQALVPFAVSQSLAPLSSAATMFPATWKHSALKVLVAARDGSIGEFAAGEPRCSSLSRELCVFFEQVLQPQDLLASLRDATWSEWCRVVTHTCNVSSADVACFYQRDDRRELSVTETDAIVNLLSASSTGDRCVQELIPSFITVVDLLAQDSVYEAAMHIAVLKFQLLVPTSPVDPMYKWSLKLQTSMSQLQYWTHVAKEFSEYNASTFRPQSKQLECANGAVALIGSSLQKARNKHRQRPDASGKQFVEFTSQARQMQSTMMTTSKLQHFSLAPSKKARTEQAEPVDVVESLMSWSSLVQQRCKELINQFAGYEDFVLPLVESGLTASFTGCAHAIQMGLDRSAQSVADAELFSLDDTIRLMAFPGRPALVAPVAHFQDVQHLETMMNYLEACMSALSDESTFESTPRTTIQRLFTCYRQIFNAIEELQEREQKADAMRVLYKEKASVIEGDDEMRLRKLKAMFPSYEDDFAEVPEEDEDAQHAVDERRARHARLIFFGRNGAAILKLARSHLMVCERWCRAKVSDVKQPLEVQRLAFASRFDALAKSLEHFKERVPQCDLELQDQLSAGFWARATLLGTQLRQLNPSTIEEKVASGFNVFVDSDPAEAAKCSKVLAALIDLAYELLQRFPDNPTLLRISKIATRISQLPVLSTPLMKVMTGCEILLRECYEWERNASTEVSVIAHINALATIVLHWRRLELHCWRHIFTAKRNEFTTRAATHWFQLRDVCDMALAGQDVTTDLFKFASDLMWSSKLGEFAARLSLLRGFGLELLAHGGETLSTANLFLQITAYFEQFSWIVERDLTKIIVPLEEDIADYCKIMRWEDSTYYAIRATTEKSHLKIARILAEMEDGLNGTALGAIQKEEHNAEEDPNMGYGVPALVQPTAATTKPKKSKRKKVEEVKAVPSPPPAAWVNPHIDDGTMFFVDGAEDIVARVASLQKPKVPQNQKMRALKMLFDALRDAGVGHTSVTRVSDWDSLFSSNDSYAALQVQCPLDLEECVSRYYRFARNVQRMREALRTPHSDLSGSQVKRGGGTCETLFASASERPNVLRSLAVGLQLLSQLHTATEARTCGVAYPPTTVGLLRGASASIAHFTSHVAILGDYIGATTKTTLAMLANCGDALTLVCHRLQPVQLLDIGAPVDAVEGALSHVREADTMLQALSNTTDTVPKAVIVAARELSIQLGSLLRSTAQSGRLTQDDSSAQPKKHRAQGAWMTALNEVMELWERAMATNHFAVSTRKTPDEATASGRDSDDDASDYQPPNGMVVACVAAVESVQHGVQAAVEATLLLLRRPIEREVLHAHERLMVKETIQSLQSRLQASAAAITANTSALCRFGLVLARLFSIVFRKGFCKPEDTEDGEGEGGEGEGIQDGTGMDDGEGEKDVTDEIDNEDQLMNMKDKEEQKEKKDQQRDDNEEDNAADVETDFQAGKEDREEDEEDDEEDGSEAEMGDVDENNAMERKKSKKDKDDGEMDEDEGDNPPDEVPPDDLAPEPQQEDNETGDFANKDEQIREAGEEDSEDGKNKEHDLIGNEEQFSDDGGSRSDGEDDDGRSTTTEGSNSDGESSGDDNNDRQDEAPEPEQREGDDGEENQELKKKEEEALGDGDASGDDVSEHSDASEVIDQNNFEDGQQDEHEGDERTKEKEQEKQRKAPEDATGAEQENQGEEQEQDDAGRSWKKQDKNETSKRKDNSNQTKSQSNPYSAIKEALKRHQRQMQQLDLDKNVKLKDDPTANDESPEAPNDAQDNADAIDEFEFHEGGQQMGLAATEDALSDTAEEQQAEEKDAESAAEEEEAPEDQSTRRRRRPNIVDEENDDAADSTQPKKEKGGKRSAKSKVETVVEDEEDDVPPVPEEETVVSVDDKLSRGRRLWLEHESRVQGMAQQLCEQLRLILAPTVADKLQGDYKTGKRINIKKIIPYIASQYKKDRIWLRRTKPNKRTYQIVVALDDSLSMQVNDAGSVSLQAVTLLSKAMQQLDVGEFGLISFGKEPRVVHPLAEPFGMESGPRAFSEITFEQSATNMRLFLESSLDYLDNERSRMGGQIRSTTLQLQQIMFVISDGQITEDRRELRKLLARAEENKQFVVLLILDIKASGVAADPSNTAEPVVRSNKTTLSVAERMRQLKAEREQRMKRQGSQASSILDMQLVEFEGTKVIKRPYLDDFPFPYYLVIKDLPTLPEIVADAMRQWFEMLNATH